MVTQQHVDLFFLKPWWCIALKLLKKHHLRSIVLLSGVVIHHYEKQHPEFVSSFLPHHPLQISLAPSSPGVCPWGDMAFHSWKWLLLLGRQNTFAKAWRSRRGGPSLRWKRCCHWSASKSLDPEVRAFLEENTEVTSSGHLTPEIRLRLLTPRCRFWREKPDLWPYGDPFWAIYWPGGQALSRYAACIARVDKSSLLWARMSDPALFVVIPNDVYLPCMRVHIHAPLCLCRKRQNLCWLAVKFQHLLYTE